jgi:hypothetical protein
LIELLFCRNSVRLGTLPSKKLVPPFQRSSMCKYFLFTTIKWANEFE